MPIVGTDLKYKLSVPSASAGGVTPQTDVNASLGKWCSTTDLVDATLNNLFDDISGDENLNEESEYRCIFIYNAHATLTWQNAVIWLSAEEQGGANISIGLDTTAASVYTSGTQQALVVANEDTAPSGVSFSSPTSKATGLSIGNLAAGYVKAIWVKRIATNSAAMANDSVTLKVEGETAA
jgi:hypothetical protein